MLLKLDGVAPVLEGDGHFVADNARVIGQVTLKARASVWFGATIRGDMAPITLGEATNVQDGAVLHTDAGLPLVVGNNVTIGHQATVHGCTVGENSLIGIQAVILNRAVIGRDTLVGAGALVPEGKTFPDGVLLLGSPAKVARELTEGEKQMLKASAAHYAANAARFAKGLEAVTP